MNSFDSVAIVRRQKRLATFTLNLYLKTDERDTSKWLVLVEQFIMWKEKKSAIFKCLEKMIELEPDKYDQSVLKACNLTLGF